MTDQKPRPLDGIRVADLSWFGAGPIAGQVLAHYGAEVIRVESESHLDGLRVAQPVAPGKSGINVSGYYNNFNASKKSLALNLNHPRARALALRLLSRCDVMLENFTPRVVEKWGLTYESVREANPALIVANMPMQGTWGPHRDFLGFGSVLAPLSGYSYLTGWPDRPPIGVGTNYPDYVINPGHAVVAILAALRYRRRTGRGQRIELAQLESTAATLSPFLMQYANNGTTPERNGNRVAYAAPHGVFPCLPLARTAEEMAEERWIAIATMDDEQWRSLIRVMGDSEWASAERFATLLGRKHDEDELERMIGTWTATQHAEALMEALQREGVPAGVVQTARDVLVNDDHLKARRFYEYLDHPEAGITAYEGLPFRLSRTPGRLASPAPLLGQHNEYVLREVLGLDDAEIADLLVDQVVF